jgi:hypothetical protein
MMRRRNVRDWRIFTASFHKVVEMLSEYDGVCVKMAAIAQAAKRNAKRG